MNEKKLKTTFILVGCLLYFLCLCISIILAILSLSQVWYTLEDGEQKGLFAYRGSKKSELTTVVFEFLGLFTTLLELACLIVLLFRVFGFKCGKHSSKFLQFQMIFSCWSTFFWYMAIATFWILTPQRTGKYEYQRIAEIHYDQNSQDRSYLTHIGTGFYYLCLSLLFSFFSMIASVSIETLVAPSQIEPRISISTSH